MGRGQNIAGGSTVKCRVSTYIPVYLHLGPPAHYILQCRLEYPHGYSSLYILMFRTIRSICNGCSVKEPRFPEVGNAHTGDITIAAETVASW